MCLRFHVNMAAIGLFDFSYCIIEKYCIFSPNIVQPYLEPSISPVLRTKNKSVELIEVLNCTGDFQVTYILMSPNLFDSSFNESIQPITQCVSSFTHFCLFSDLFVLNLAVQYLQLHLLYLQSS